MNMHAQVTVHAHSAKRYLLDAGAGLHARASQSQNKGVISKLQSKRKGSSSKAHARRNIRKELQPMPAPLTDHCRGYPHQPPAIGLRRACLSAITSFAAMHDSATVEALDLGRLLPALSLDDAETCHIKKEAERILDDTTWLLEEPNTPVTTVHIEAQQAVGLVGPASFAIVRDDLLHPIAGSKLRKFDARFPELIKDGTSHLITCGGLQSGHNAAFAAAAAESGISAHLLVRGEQLEIPSGFHLLTRMFGAVTYVTRKEYSDREKMFQTHVELLQQSIPADAKVAVVAEGAADAVSLLGLVRLARYLGVAPSADEIGTIVVDSGTGTSAIGLALGANLLKLPFRVVGVMLAGKQAYYDAQTDKLLAEFGHTYGLLVNSDRIPLTWIDRPQPRKFGDVLPGEIEQCSRIARKHGVLLDPVYSLAAWEVAAGLAAAGHPNVAMLHAGGSLGLQSLAQRFPSDF